MKSLIILLFTFVTVAHAAAAPPPRRPGPPPPRRPLPPPQPRYLQVGDRAYNVQRESALVTVVGIQPGGRYVIRFEEGPLFGQVGSNWSIMDLAIPYGCGNYFCVGDQAYNLARNNARVQVIGVEYDGRYVLYYFDGVYAGQRGAHWSDFDLAHAK